MSLIAEAAIPLAKAAKRPHLLCRKADSPVATGLFGYLLHFVN